MYGPRTIWCVDKIIFWRVMMTKAWHVVTFVTWVMAIFQIENLKRNAEFMFNVIVLHRWKRNEKRNIKEIIGIFRFSISIGFDVESELRNWAEKRWILQNKLAFTFYGVIHVKFAPIKAQIITFDTPSCNFM